MRRTIHLRNALLAAAALLVSACAVNHRAAIPIGTIPSDDVPTFEATEYGRDLYEDLIGDLLIDDGGKQLKRLKCVFAKVARAAGVDPSLWNLYVVNEPGKMDVRAVHGNYLFVWQETFNTVSDDSELAGLLAWELAHDLAGQTEPVEFSLGSEVLFMVSDMVATVGAAAISGGVLAVSAPGLTRWAYTEAADLDPMDRVYTREEIERVAPIALLILDNSDYGIQGLTGFWQRAEADEVFAARTTPLIRKIQPSERVALLRETTRRLADGGHIDDAATGDAASRLAERQESEALQLTAGELGSASP